VPRTGNYTKETIAEVLTDFIDPEECDGQPLPRDFDANIVGDYVSEQLSADYDALSTGRVVEVSRFYKLNQVINDVINILIEAPQTHEELKKTCHLLKAVAELGNPGQQQHAVDVFQGLVPLPLMESSKSLELLVETFFYLPGSAPTQQLDERVAECLANCKRNGPKNELWRFREVATHTWPWVRSEKGRKDWLHKMPEGEERNAKWAEAYLMFDMKTPFKWDLDAGFGLLRIARRDSDEAAAKALKQAMSLIVPTVDPKEVEVAKFRKTRGYKAREFFLETLTEEEADDRDASMVSQEDLIA
jgi:hypothetical protein